VAGSLLVPFDIVPDLAIPERGSSAMLVTDLEILLVAGADVSARGLGAPPEDIAESSRAVFESRPIMLMGRGRVRPFGTGIERVGRPDRVPLGIRRDCRFAGLGGSSIVKSGVKMSLRHIWCRQNIIKSKNCEGEWCVRCCLFVAAGADLFICWW
jgi:hypothetical protein